MASSASILRLISLASEDKSSTIHNFDFIFIYPINFFKIITELESKILNNVLELWKQCHPQ